jgi:hypothetical protein
MLSRPVLLRQNRNTQGKSGNRTTLRSAVRDEGDKARMGGY